LTSEFICLCSSGTYVMIAVILNREIGAWKDGGKMETKVFQIRDKEDGGIFQAAQVLRQGGLVAFPTETVYGLGANALDEEAAHRIYAAKGRPSDNPLIAHISSIKELEPLVTKIPETGRKLSETFWPGPLTLVFPKSRQVPYGTTGGLETVAVRMPGAEVARRLIALAGVPVAAPSANLSGKPSPTTAQHVWQDMNGRIDIILDGGPVGIGLESTIVDVSEDVPVLLRPGAITREMLEKAVGHVRIDPAILGRPNENIRPKAPGMKYRHYAPRAELTLVEGNACSVVEKINELVENDMASGKQVGIICTEETKGKYRQGILRSVGRRSQEETIAHNLFAVLREFDDLEVDCIYSESFSQDHLGYAIMNRLMKAAGYRTIYV
jgi:L-threonylcarbamoyladenylate synthase